MAQIESNDVIDRLVSMDPTLGLFLDDGFQSEEYAMKIVTSEVVSDVLDQLNKSIQMLNTELHTQISSRHEDLLAQTTGIESLESVLEVMTSRIASLKELINRISLRITEPFNKLKSRTVQLARLQDATDLLRRLIRLFYLTKRLRQQMSSEKKEITKAAQTLNELNFLENDGEPLDGINIIEEDRVYIAKTRKELDKEAHRILEKGMNSGNPSAIATALQVFYNLDCLGASVNNVFNEVCINAEKSIQEAVDIRLLTDSSKSGGGPGKANLHMVGNQQNLKVNLWASLDEMVEQLYLSIVNIQQLQRVLVKKRDPITHVLFCDKLRKEGFESNIGLRFWKQLLQKLEKHLRKAAQYNQVIKSAFELEFPKLLKIILNFWDKVSQNNEGYQLMFYGTLKNSNVMEMFDLDLKTESQIDYDAEEQLRKSISSFQMAFVSSNLNNLSSPIQSSFLSSVGNKTAIPDEADIEAIYKSINYEIGQVIFDHGLQQTVSKNIEKAISLFAAKVEGNINRSNQTSQIFNAPNEAQVQNLNLANSLFYLQSSLDSIISENRDYLSEEAKIILLGAKDQLDELIGSILLPLFSSVSDSIEAIILTMHKEDFSAAEYHAKKPSPYIREMETFIKRVVRDHFSEIKAKAFVSQNMEPIANKALLLFVRHSILVRPLGQGGKLKLIQDYSLIEEALSPLCSRLIDLGDSYRLLRAFKPLFDASLEDLVANPSLGVSIPISMVIQLIISRSPKELKSPFQNAGWTHSQYSQWLDEHESEKERLSLLKGTIENYTKSVQKTGKSEFVSELPVIMDLLKKGLV